MAAGAIVSTLREQQQKLKEREEREERKRMVGISTTSSGKGKTVDVFSFSVSSIIGYLGLRECTFGNHAVFDVVFGHPTRKLKSGYAPLEKD